MPEKERDNDVFEVAKNTLTFGVGNYAHKKTQYQILDECGWQIAVVYSESEAEGLVSHLNRG
jgi:hypothetical protein